MIWLAWRQVRSNALLAAGAVLVVAVTLVVTRSHVASIAGTDRTVGAYEYLRLLGTALIGLPAFLGAFWGAPLVAREVESGTHWLVWTQSVTRRRWLTTRLAATAATAALTTAVFSVVFSWWSAPFDEFGSRTGTANFGQRGLVPVAYAVFAVALGTFAGSVLRRTLPAMAATLGGFFLCRFGFQLLVRPRLIDAVSASLPNNSFGQRSDAGPSGWILSSHTVDRTGHTLTTHGLDDLLVRTCGLTRDSPRSGWVDCIERLGVHDIARFHPDSHFWPLQIGETICFLGIAGALACAAAWWVGHRLV